MIQGMSSQWALPTRVSDAEPVSPAERKDELGGKPPHERHGNGFGGEVEIECVHILAHELEYKTDMFAAIGARVFKMVNKVTDVLAALVGDVGMHAGRGAEAEQSVTLSDTIFVLAGCQDFEC